MAAVGQLSKTNMTEKVPISKQDLDNIRAILENQLAEMCIQPRDMYHLDYFRDYSTADYKTLLFGLKNSVKAALEHDGHREEDAPAESDDSVDGGAYDVHDTDSLVFYTIRDNSESGYDQDDMFTIYDTPYFKTREECIAHICNDFFELREVVWELLCHSDPRPLFTTAHKLAYFESATTRYASVTKNIENWLTAGSVSYKNLMTPCDRYENHFKVSEPKYDIDVYIRFDEAEVYISR